VSASAAAVDGDDGDASFSKFYR